MFCACKQWISDKRTRLFQAAALSCAALLAATALGQSAQVHIRILNANTNTPITDEQLNVGLHASQIGSVAMATDKYGVIVVDTGSASTIRILSNMYADCRSRGELYTDYPIATILKTGITTGNLCSNASPPPKPGELLLFEKPKDYIPTMRPDLNR
jgi:hypothetical protein